MCVCFFSSRKIYSFLGSFCHSFLFNQLQLGSVLTVLPDRNTGPSAGRGGGGWGKMHTVSLWNYVWETGLALRFIRNKKNKHYKWRT